jgi:signal transduction histidine kinase
MAGSVAFVGLDWIFTRGQAAPPDLGAIAALRLPWAAVPAAGWLLQRTAPGWRHLPKAVVALSVAWAWAAVIGYFAIGLEGSVIQAITLFACLVTTAALLPLTGAGRAGVFAVMAVGYVAFDLAWPHQGSMAARRADDAAVLAFAVIQVLVLQGFEAARQRSAELRHSLQRSVAELAASRARAAAAVGEVERLAAEVAHQVNNPLSAIKVNVRWLATEGAEPEQAAERAEVVVESMQAIDRIVAIVAALKRRAAEQQEELHREDAATTATGLTPGA